MIKVKSTAVFASACEASLDHGAAPHSMAERAAATTCALLLTGATGTGKGHLARWIHAHSPRAAGPFVPVNCGAIPDSLIDSHLFGHAKGSFSGAAADHLGLVRAAAGGTLLLDEVSELPLSAQTRLLRLLEEREVQPVGFSRPLVVDVRIIAATNGDLLSAVRAGRFREDLYFRLDVVRLHLTPLCERRDEIEDLTNLFNGELPELYRQPVLELDDEVTAWFMHHSWPGNIRELRTIIERLYVLCGERSSSVTMDDLRRFGQLRVPTQFEPASGLQHIAALKLEAVNHVLHSCAGNVSRAASTLGVHRSTLYRWLAEPPAAV